MRQRGVVRHVVHRAGGAHQAAARFAAPERYPTRGVGVVDGALAGQRPLPSAAAGVRTDARRGRAWSVPGGRQAPRPRRRPRGGLSQRHAAHGGRARGPPRGTDTRTRPGGLAPRSHHVAARRVLPVERVRLLQGRQRTHANSRERGVSRVRTRQDTVRES